MRLDWNNPKITVTDLDSFLSNYLTSNYDGVNVDGTYVTINTREQMTGDQENHISSWFNSLSGIPQQNVIVSMPAFASPTHRVKNDATHQIVVCQPGTSIDMDYAVGSEDRYTSGGELIAQNSVFGDYITGEVIDKDGLIPPPYRAAMCESYPTISKYVLKQWVGLDGKCTIDTRPLNAKIPSGFYLRITYIAVSSGIPRNIAINYFLQKEL